MQILQGEHDFGRVESSHVVAEATTLQEDRKTDTTSAMSKLLNGKDWADRGWLAPDWQSV